MKKHIYTASIILLTVITVFVLLTGLFPEILFLVTVSPLLNEDYGWLGAIFTNIIFLPGSLTSIICVVLYVPSFITYRASCTHYNAGNYKTAKRFGIAQTVFYFICTLLMAFLSLFWCFMSFVSLSDDIELVLDSSSLSLNWFVYLCALLYSFGTLVFFAASVGNIVYLRHKSKKIMLLKD